MVPEVFIVGDAFRQKTLIQSVRDAGYDVTLCQPEDLMPQIEGGHIPACVILCAPDQQSRSLLSTLRRSRAGVAVPVVLYGPLGQEVRDLADVLELGADHFIDEKTSAAEVSEALLELAGPVRADAEPETELHGRSEVGGADGRMEASGPVEELRPQGERTGEQTGPRPAQLIKDGQAFADLATDTGSGASKGAGSGADSDPVFSALHRTLDRLEARLRDREARGEQESEIDDVDLDAMGLEAIPQVDQEHHRPVGDERGDTLALVTEAFDESEDGEPTPHEETVNLGRAASPTTVQPLPSALGEASPPIQANEEGNLQDMELPLLLWRLHADGFSGTAELCDGTTVVLEWRQGELVGVEGSGGDFVDRLVRRGILTTAQRKVARALVAPTARESAARLVDKGLIKPREISWLRREYAEALIEDCFEWLQCQYACFAADAIADSVTEVVDPVAPIETLVYRGVSDRMDTDDYAEDARAQWADANPDFDALVQRFSLSPAEADWVRSLDSKELLRNQWESRDSVLPAVERAALLRALEICGEIEIHEGPQRLSPEEMDQQRLDERLRYAREGSYFELLSVGRDASRSEIRRAARQLLATFADDRLEASTVTERGRDLEELRTAVSEAREILLDEALRTAYLAHLVDEPA